MRGPAPTAGALAPAPSARGRRVAALAASLCALVVALALALGAAPARAARGPSIDASSAALLDADTGQLLWGSNDHARVAIASTTKLMTALLTLEKVKLGAVFTEPRYYPSAADSQIGLVPGERMTVHDLLLALLLPSADDAAEDLAYNIGGGSVARFIAMMNARARQLGLRDTHYTTPIGLDTAGNYSTADDLVKLARYVMGAQPFFRHAVAQTQAVLHSGNHERLIINRNDLVGRIPWINGIKTGHTLQAGYVLVGSGARNGMNLISVVLGTPSIAQRDTSTLAVLRYGFANFGPRTIVRRGQVITHLKLKDRTGAPAAVVAAAGYASVFAHSAVVRTQVKLVRELAAPQPYHARVGTLVLFANGRVIDRIPLLLAHAIPAPQKALLARVAGPITLVVALLLVCGAVVVAGFGRRGVKAQGRRRR